MQTVLTHLENLEKLPAPASGVSTHRGIMKLLISGSGLRAGHCFIQLGHRKTAIEYALVALKVKQRLNVDALGDDPLTLELEDTMRFWVEETLLQGAYLREYHLWEKDCKAYFSHMAARNGIAWSEKPRQGIVFTAHIGNVLNLFGSPVPNPVMDRIDAMRKRVNDMKHESGLTMEHFVTAKDFETALEALEDFWNSLCQHEIYKLG